MPVLLAAALRPEAADFFLLPAAADFFLLAVLVLAEAVLVLAEPPPRRETRTLAPPLSPLLVKLRPRPTNDSLAASSPPYASMTLARDRPVRAMISSQRFCSRSRRFWTDLGVAGASL